ncbi:MAG: asparagine--tRNA ligase [Patescibacteria group bacterium]
MQSISIREVAKNTNVPVRLSGWIFRMRSSGKIHFLHLRDGSGEIQGIVDEGAVSAEAVEQLKQITTETSVILEGTAKKEPRAPSGYEIHVSNLQIVHVAENYPIGKKEHGPDFLLDMRHLWIRSPKQWAILNIRDEIIWALRLYFKEHDFRLTDTPILTPTSCEGTTTLFKTDYFGEPAYLSQSGQLYLEALAMSLGRVYDFGPVFRAEKSKTRRHLTEFWMLDAEMTFCDYKQNMDIQEDVVRFVAQHVLETCTQELALLDRDQKKIEQLTKPYVRMTYVQALEELRTLGSDIKDGEDFGNDDETILMQKYDVPVFVTQYPLAIKAFYMKPDPENPEYALCSDLLLPEGYGEVSGGSQRIDDLTLLKKKIKEHKLLEKDFDWYLDLRRYGSVPHSGFGIGLERLVAFFCGLAHIRETIPFPRLINRLRP